MDRFDFTPGAGRSTTKARPSAARIIAAWKRAGRPPYFEVTYGETHAEFMRGCFGRWYYYGNGCRGVDRAAVVRALEADEGTR